jgi:branched-chain amino acid transport system permease protein
MQLFLQTLASSLTIGALYALIALGFSLILGTLRVVDFAYGSYVLLAAYVTFWSGSVLFGGKGIATAIASILLGATVTALFSAFLWGVVLRRLLDRTHLTQLVGSLGVAAAIGGVLLSLFGTNVVLADYTLTRVILQAGSVYIAAGRVAAGLIGLGSLLAFAALLKTRYGLMIRGIAMDPKGAAVVGIDVFRLRILTVSIGAALGGLAGGLLVTFLPVSPADANKFLLIAFFTIAIGGLGSLRGAMIGAFLIALVEGYAQNYLPNVIKNAVPYLFVCGFIFLVPQGLGNIRVAFSGRS